jgi:hypothetical protein
VVSWTWQEDAVLHHLYFGVARPTYSDRCWQRTAAAILDRSEKAVARRSERLGFGMRIARWSREDDYALTGAQKWNPQEYADELSWWLPRHGFRARSPKACQRRIERLRRKGKLRTFAGDAAS